MNTEERNINIKLKRNPIYFLNRSQYYEMEFHPPAFQKKLLHASLFYFIPAGF